MENKIRYFILVFLFFNTVFFAYGQRVSYTLIEDNPYAIKHLYVRLNPIYFEGFRANKASIGVGVEVRYLLKDKFIFNFNNWKSYSTIAENTAGDKFLLRDLSAEFILIDKASEGDVRVNLSSSTSESAKYRTTATKYIQVPGTTRKILAIRGGVLNYKTPFEPTDLKKIDYNKILDTGGISLSQYAIAGSLVKSTSVFVGLSYSVIHNTKIKVEGYRKIKSNQTWLNLYADIMFAPVVTLDNFYDENISNSWFIIENGNNGIEKKRLGWRTGFVTDFHTTKLITFSGRVEVGSRTGIKNNGFYLYCGMGATVILLKHKNTEK